MKRKALAILFLFTALVASAQTYVRKTNLPTVYINTFGNVPITSKETYVYATMHYVDENDAVTAYDSLQIRGRGNSTWGFSKKPYRIKFQDKERLLGADRAKAKSWTLLANAADKSLIRNAVTSLMGEFTSLKFNPAAKFVDFVLNGNYLGNYQISDQMEVRKRRVDVVEQDLPLLDTSDISGGYLLEVDGFMDGNCFTTSTYSVPIRIVYPDDEDIVASQNQYIKKYIADFETVLNSRDYADPDKGYRAWVDSMSLADWYICTELTANIDGFWSTYFYKDQADSLLYWGPLWDYDIAYNNDTRKPGTQTQLMTDYGYGQTKEWINRMWSDPWFAKLVNRRYTELLDAGLTDYLYNKIDSLTELLQRSQELNYQKWGINRRVYHEIVLYSSYDQYIADLKTFISEHSEWLKTAFAQKKPAEPTPPFSPGMFYYRIINAKTAKGLDIQGTGVVQYANTEGRLSQDWYIKPVGDYVQIINRDANLALNDPTIGNVGPTVNIGTQLNVVSPDETSSRQLWTLVPQGTAGYYNLLNSYTQHIANLQGGSANDYTSILSYTNDSRNGSSTNRLWYIVAGDDLPEEITGISDIEPEEYALAYNPQTFCLHFGSETPDRLTFTASVYSLGGAKVGTFRASEGFDMSACPAGVYVVTWKTGGNTRSAKFRR